MRARFFLSLLLAALPFPALATDGGRADGRLADTVETGRWGGRAVDQASGA